MAKPAKITDLTAVEGDPDPSRADIPDTRMHLELQARGSWQAGFVRFVARCSERSPVARAIVVTLLLVVGAALAAGGHYALNGLVPGWVNVAAMLLLVFAPTGVYWALARSDRDRLGGPELRPLSALARDHAEARGLAWPAVLSG
jgi:hypothetical protein